MISLVFASRHQPRQNASPLNRAKSVGRWLWNNPVPIALFLFGAVLAWVGWDSTVNVDPSGKPLGNDSPHCRRCHSKMLLEDIDGDGEYTFRCGRCYPRPNVPYSR